MQCFQWNKEQARVIYDDRMKSSLYRIMIMPWIRSHQGSLCAPPKRWEAWTGFNHLEQYPDQIFKPPCIFTSYLPFGVKGLLPPGCNNDSIGHKAEHIFRGGGLSMNRADWWSLVTWRDLQTSWPLWGCFSLLYLTFDTLSHCWVLISLNNSWGACDGAEG